MRSWFGLDIGVCGILTVGYSMGCKVQSHSSAIWWVLIKSGSLKDLSHLTSKYFKLLIHLWVPLAFRLKMSDWTYLS